MKKFESEVIFDPERGHLLVMNDMQYHLLLRLYDDLVSDPDFPSDISLADVVFHCIFEHCYTVQEISNEEAERIMNGGM